MAGSKASLDVFNRIRRARAFVTGVMVLERIWPLLLPLLIVVSLYLTVAWFGAFRLVADWARLSVASAFALATLAALWPLTRFRWPPADQVNGRIEQANQLAHTPLLAQTDQLTGSNDAFAEALWREHKQRIASGLGNLAGDFPKTGLPERDPWGLRAVVPLLLVIAFSWSFGAGGGTIYDPLRQHNIAPVIPPRIDAWVTPPAYTGKPPIFMTERANATRDAFSVPAGSVVTLRATGANSPLSLSFNRADGDQSGIAVKDPVDPARPFEPQQFEAELSGDGSLELKAGETTLQAWSFSITPDLPPVISFAGEPKRALNGTLDLQYLIEDDYGAVEARAEFESIEPQSPGARPLYQAPDFPLHLSRRGGKKAKFKTSRNLTGHPWAGTPVTARLTAIDAAGQKASSKEKRFILPERAFSNPLARAVVEQRRILALDANKRQRVLDLMDAVTLRPEDTFKTMAHYLALSSARTRLKMASSDDQLRDVADYLWEIALGIEDGDLSAAQKRLRQAQEALRKALENGATDEEIEKLVAELREAMNEYMRELAEKAMQDPQFSQQSQPSQELAENDLQKMLDRIEQLAKSGARDKAQELLSQLQDMMNNLQAGQQDGQQSGQTQMRQQMNELGEIMRRQQELMNETFRMDQMQRGQRGQEGNQGQRGQQQQDGQSGNRPGEEGSGGMTSGEMAEAFGQLQQGQGGLQGQLGQLLEGLRGLGINPDGSFGEADREMGEAGKALGGGEGEQALGNQGAALEALRRGAKDMMSQMQQAMQGDSAGSQLGGQSPRDRDPLGRPQATTGPDFGEGVRVPDEIDVQRAREILEAIRKRLGNALSPALEKQYLERLLDLR